MELSYDLELDTKKKQGSWYFHYKAKKKEKKEKLFGCPPPPAPNFWKLEKKVFSVQKYTTPNYQNSPKVFLFLLCFLRILIFHKYF